VGRHLSTLAAAAVASWIGKRDLEESKRRFRVTWTDMRAKLPEADIEAARHQIEDNKRRPWNR
jgi:hypothetical protein